MKLVEDLLYGSFCIKLCLLFLMLKWILRVTMFIEACLCLWTLYWCVRGWFWVKRNTITVKHKRSNRLGLWFRLFLLIYPLVGNAGGGRFNFWHFVADNWLLNSFAVLAFYAAIFEAAVVSCSLILC